MHFGDFEGPARGSIADHFGAHFGGPFPGPSGGPFWNRFLDLPVGHCRGRNLLVLLYFPVPLAARALPFIIARGILRAGLLDALLVIGTGALRAADCVVASGIRHDAHGALSEMPLRRDLAHLLVFLLELLDPF